VPLRTLSAKNFRNLDVTDLTLDDRLTLLVGANAQGKTNCLEAIMLLVGRVALRGQSERDMVATGESTYHLAGEWVDESGRPHRLERAVMLAPYRRRVVGPVIPAVSFTPDDLWMIKGSPESRRHYLDSLGAQLSPRYRHELGRFQRAVSQRNKALKEGASDSVLESFEAVLAEAGSFLWARRFDLVGRLGAVLGPLLAELAVTEVVTVSLEFGGQPDDPTTSGLARRLAENRPLDRARGMTSTGPHRDDLRLTVNGRPADTHASQGQQRLLALALKLAGRALLEEATGIRPLVLLDDVLSELDARRQSALLHLMSQAGQQTVVTGTEVRSFGALDPLVCEVTAGRVRPCGKAI
jgi:DNA replication and repair protein RecF